MCICIHIYIYTFCTYTVLISIVCVTVMPTAICRMMYLSVACYIVVCDISYF